MGCGGAGLQSSEQAWRRREGAQPVPVTCEVIVLDDASTDGTLQAVAEFVDPALLPPLPSSVKLEYTVLRAETNAGQAAGRNSAAARAKGEILFFLDADDVFMPTHLAGGWSVSEAGRPSRVKTLTCCCRRRRCLTVKTEAP
jgi:cellulose synthase/poly-beta-1,6-N-acetylglucosamine synthase-like glycosyltransferase